MSGLAIDTLRYAKRLRAAGFSEEQAEVQAEAPAEAVRDSLVTKVDLNEAVEKLRREIRDVSLTTKADLNEAIEKLRGELRDVRVEMRDLHASLIRWFIPLLLGQLAAMAALVKLL